ncbi:MAG: hypothetical protein ABIK86_03955, partial [candidate division WOR-3 bacterium]
MVLALCSLPQAVGAQTTSRVVGDVRMVMVGEAERVRLRPGVSRGETFDAVRLNLVCDEMNRRLTELGFLWNKVTWDTVRRGQRLDVRFVAVTGRRARVAAWNVAGDTEVVGVVLSVLPAAGSIFGRTMLERVVRRAV